jgi:hypothetical protein
MIGAWPYATSAIERGMSATAGYRDYEAGGGTIRTSDWFALARLARDAQATGDLVAGQPWVTPIPGQAYTESGYDYSERYTVVADVTYVDTASGALMKRQVAVQSDEIGTWDDTEASITEAMGKYGEVDVSAGITVTRARFYTPRGVRG